jgi:hypothetical protein
LENDLVRLTVRESIGHVVVVEGGVAAHLHDDPIVAVRCETYRSSSCSRVDLR